MIKTHGINLTGRGLRGESQADILRRTGRYGVLPTDNDDEAMGKLNAAAEAAAATAEAASGPNYPDTATGLAATEDGEGFAVDNGDGTVTVWLNDGGTAVEQRTLATTSYLASPNGADAVGASDGTTVQDALDAYPADLPVGLSPVVLRTILLDAQVSRMLSGAGDGDADPAAVAAETAKFQALANTGRSFSVPTPANTFRVNTIRPFRGQLIEGDGRFPLTTAEKYLFTGNGVDPVFELGDGTSSGPRAVTLRNMSVYNDGAECIWIDLCPDFLIDRVSALAVGADCVYGNLSVRGTTSSSRLICSGPHTAVRLVNNFNGLFFPGNTLSGGSAGRAMVLESTQNAVIPALRIEASLDGLWIASTTDTGYGQCSAITLDAFYAEQCKTPLVIGKQSKVASLAITSGIISNNNTSSISEREACVQLGRVSGFVNTLKLYPLSTEDLVWLWMNDQTGGFGDFVFRPPDVTGTPNATHAFKGTYASTGAAVRAGISAKCDFGFMGGANRLGSNEPREWVSPLIDSSVSTGIMTWLPDALINMGGLVLGAEIIDYNGGVLTGVKLEIGRSTSLAETVNVADMSTLTFSNGYAALTIGTGNIFDATSHQYRVTTASGATGKFRIRIRYRAN